MDESPAPRPAATVLLLRDDPLRVLLVQRPATGAFPSVLAFPGGAAEAGDVDAATTAARETLEEVGVVLDGGRPATGRSSRRRHSNCIVSRCRRPRTRRSRRPGRRRT